MKKEEKQLIIDLLFDKYKKTKEDEILDLIKKVEKVNFSANNFILCNSYITGEKALIDCNDLSFDTLDLSNTYLEIKDNKIKILKGGIITWIK